jgi:hypothetical protein
VKSCSLSRPPSTLAGDNQIIFAIRPEENRLKNSTLRNRFCQFGKRRLVELKARLARIRADPSNIDLAHSASRSAAFG